MEIDERFTKRTNALPSTPKKPSEQRAALREQKKLQDVSPEKENAIKSTKRSLELEEDHQVAAEEETEDSSERKTNSSYNTKSKQVKESTSKLTNQKKLPTDKENVNRNINNCNKSTKRSLELEGDLENATEKKRKTLLDTKKSKYC